MAARLMKTITKARVVTGDIASIQEFLFIKTVLTIIKMCGDRKYDVESL